MAKREDLIRQFGEAEEKKPPQAKNEPLSVPSSPVAKDEPKTDNVNHHGGKIKIKRKRAKKKFFAAVRNILTDKTLSKMLNVFLFCMIVNVVEYFFIIRHLGIQTRGIMGKVLGTLIILGYMYTARLKPHNIGLSTNPRAIRSGFKNALIFNLAIIPAYILEFLGLKFVLKKDVIIRVFAYDSPLSEVGPFYFIANTLLLLAVTALSAVMLEVLFRGILIKMGKGKFGFWQTAVIVSLFYSFWYLVVPLSKLVSGYTASDVLMQCLFYIIFEFIISLKWCMCSRATGSIWLSVFDHFIFNSALNFIHIINSTSGKVDVDLQTRLIIIQAVSFVFCFSYYKMKMRKKERLLQKVGIRSIYSFDSLAEMSEEDVSRHAERIKTAEGEIDPEYLKLLERNKEKNLY